MKKHYQALGLKEGASQEEVQEAFERLSNALNPSNNNNQEFFIEEYDKVQEAYKALSNSSILGLKTAKTTTSKSNYDLKTPNVSIENKKNKNMFTYIFNRKRNILTFVVLVFILKLVLHFFLFTETEKAVNYDKKIYVNYRTINFYTLINNSLVKNTSKKEIITSYREGLNPTTKNGQEYIFEDGVCDDCGYSLFYYPKEIHTQSFKVHLQKIFSNKPNIFLIAICILLFLLILFNDKIKAR